MSKLTSTVVASNNGEERKHRLMISKMELENFKSYAGAQAIGPFHKCFSSIVGPNGSGKSNVIDALLFVFGKRAKQLRLNKVSELIHKSAKFPSLDYARVSVYFQLIYDQEDSEDDFEVVPNSEFTITRIAYQNNSSKYTVDGKVSSYTEVGQLLRSYGVDLDNNRFLILQGEVEQIAMMKPKALTPHEEGLLEYLEDIIGSNQYVEKIEETSKALEGMNEQRVEKVHRLKLAEKERDALQESKHEVEVLLTKELELRYKKHLLFSLYQGALHGNLSGKEARLSDVNEEVRKAQQVVRSSEEAFATMQKSAKSKDKEFQALDKQLASAMSEHDAFERKDVKLQEDAKYQKTNLKKQQASLSKETKKMKEAQEECEALAQQIDKYDSLLTDFEKKKTDEETELDALMASLQGETIHLREALSEKQQLLAGAEKQASEQIHQQKLLDSAMTLLRSRSEKATKQVDTVSHLRTALAGNLTEARTSLEKLLAYENTTYAPRYTTLKQRLDGLTAQEESLSENIRAKQVAYEQASSDFQTSKQMSGRQKTILHLLHACQTDGHVLSGVKLFGRLGDLACISSQYDVAMTVACRQLDYLVVQSVQDATLCVQYLRTQSLGRFSFFILDQMLDEWIGRMRNGSSFVCPPGTVRLFDMLEDVQEADKLRPIFYSALRDTLVAKDLDQAVSVAYEGDRVVHKVVTIDGQVIDTSGAMSGGGGEVRKGGMKLSTASDAAGKKQGKNSSKAAKAAAASAGPAVWTQDQLDTLQQEVVGLQQQLVSLRANRVAAESELASLQAEYEHTKNEISKTKLSIARMTEQLAEYDQTLAGLTAETGLTANEAAELRSHEAQRQAVEAQILTLTPNLRTLQNEVNSLQRQILSFGGPKVTKCQGKIDSYAQQVATLSSSLSTKQVELASAKKNLDKARASAEKCEAEILKCEEKIVSYSKEVEAMKEDARKIVAIVAELTQTRNALASEVEAGSGEVKGVQDRLQKAQATVVDLLSEKEKVVKEVKEAQEENKRLLHEIKLLQKQHNQERQELITLLKNVGMDVLQSTNAGSKNTSSSDEGMMEVDGESSSSSANAAKTTPLQPQLQVDDMVVQLVSGVYSVLPQYKYNTATDDDEEDAEETVTDKALLLSSYKAEEVKKEVSVLEAERNKLKGNSNMNALAEYYKKSLTYATRLHELEQLNTARDTLKTQYEAYRQQRLTCFMTGFGVISLRLKEMYQMITLGGDAELELLDSLDPFSEGISFSVRPPKKSWKAIGNLSGGEKTLSSLALVFALHYYKPTPLYVMDEIDAALDFKNVSIVANYIKERTKNAQFIIISLRNNMFELADRLVGIYKTHDHTKSVTINPKLFHPSNSIHTNNDKENNISHNNSDTNNLAS